MRCRSGGTAVRCACGADWGGTIAWNTAIWYPKVVEKLVTCCGAHPELYFRNMDADQKKRCGKGSNIDPARVAHNLTAGLPLLVGKRLVIRFVDASP